jgi:hypothetical protein
LRVDGILGDAYVGDVRLLQLALFVNLGEAALGDAAAFVIEALGARHARRGGARAGSGRRAPWRSRPGSSRVATQAVGVVVARPAVHAGESAGERAGAGAGAGTGAGTLHGSAPKAAQSAGPNCWASAGMRMRAVPSMWPSNVRGAFAGSREDRGSGGQAQRNATQCSTARHRHRHRQRWAVLHSRRASGGGFRRRESCQSSMRGV